MHYGKYEGRSGTTTNNIQVGSNSEPRAALIRYCLVTKGDLANLSANTHGSIEAAERCVCQGQVAQKMECMQGAQGFLPAPIADHPRR